ncbi:MAG: Ig-like domain-containing protein [Rheinheimera sp.]|nr:Ig-like domain-containing protein [Rheinheimera sp.]
MRNIRQLLVAFLMSAVVACGGGGSIGGGGTTTTPVYTLALSMSDAAGQAATTVSKAAPLTVTVKLAATNGGAISGKLVTFTLNDSSLASFNNGAGTAQTNASGEASIGLLVGNKSGAGMITATLASGEKAEITFSSAGDGGVVGAESNVTVRLLKSDGTVSNDLSITTPLTIEATFTSSKVAVAGQIISFQLSDSALAKFSNSTASAITDSTGVARLALSVGTKNGVGTITPIHAGQAYTAVAFNSAGDDPSGQAAVITLTLQTKTGVVSSQINKDTPLDAVVVLKSATGVPVADKQINFEINIAGLAYFGNQTATARTDATGTAKIGLTAGTTNGTGTITASLDTDENIAASRPFDSAGDGGPITSDPVSSVLLQSDKLQLGSGSTDKIELTAIVKDSNQVLLKDSKVTFAIETGSDAELEVVSGTTNNMGVATATLTSRSNLTLRDVLVSATAGSSSKKSVLTIKVVGTDIQVVAPSAVVLGNAVDLSFDLIDSASQPIRNTGMQLTSSLNNQFSNANPVSDTSTGRAVVKYTASTSGSDIVTVTALGVTKSFTILVNSDSFGFVAPSNEAPIPEIPLNTSASAKIKWTRNTSPMVGEPVSFATTRGYVGATELALDDKKIVASNTTDSAGESQVFMKSEFAGLANVSASTTGSLLLQTQKIVEFVATVPSGPLEVQAFPAQLGVGEKAIVQAIVRDVRNNPVKNQQVAFTLIDAAGGQLSPATAITNSQGIAVTEFLADATTPGGGTSGEPKGLKISASFSR